MHRCSHYMEYRRKDEFLYNQCPIRHLREDGVHSYPYASHCMCYDFHRVPWLLNKLLLAVVFLEA